MAEEKVTYSVQVRGGHESAFWHEDLETRTLEGARTHRDWLVNRPQEEEGWPGDVMKVGERVRIVKQVTRYELMPEEDRCRE